MPISQLTSSPDVFINGEITVSEVVELFICNNLDKLIIKDSNDEEGYSISRDEIASLLLDGCPLNLRIIEVIKGFKEKNSLLALSYTTSSETPEQSARRLLYIKEFYHRLNKRKEFLEACFDSTYTPIIAINKDGIIDVYNQAATVALNMKLKEAVGRNYRSVMGNNYFVEVFETGQTQTATKFRRHGKTFLSNRTPVIKDGKIIGAIAVFQDASETENIMETLNRTKKLNQQLDEIIDSSFDGLCLTDKNGDTLRINKGFERISGLIATECIGRNMADMIKDGLVSRSGSLLALEQHKRVTVTLQTKNGKTALATSNPIFDESGKIVMVVTNVRDITELNELQNKFEQSEGLNQFYQKQLVQMEMRNSKQFIVHSKPMKDLMNLLIRIAAVDSRVLIQGESGVGKELIVDIIHENSCRREGPLVKVNCAAIPENLLESELFGYEPGAFSGASAKGKIGLFELANKGVILLDEIGDMPLNLQAKILRTIQDMRITRVGGIKATNIDVRIIASTNRNLQKLIEKNLFREDLYYRLNVIPVYVPALRERKEDIHILAHYFLNRFSKRYNTNQRIKNLTAEAMAYLIDYSWPGNVRELENTIERLVVTIQKDTIDIEDIPERIRKFRHSVNILSGSHNLRNAVEETEKKILQDAFITYKSTYEIARILGVNQSTVVRKAARYGISHS